MHKSVLITLQVSGIAISLSTAVYMYVAVERAAKPTANIATQAQAEQDTEQRQTQQRSSHGPTGRAQVEQAFQTLFQHASPPSPGGGRGRSPLGSRGAPGVPGWPTQQSRTSPWSR